MNKNINIKEGNITRKLAPIDKLKVNTTDNKESVWVPSEKASTGVLHASENGIYIASEDGYEAYSEVIVRVTKDSFEGDTSFDDWDYETPDMDLSNWDPETIEDFELDHDGFDDVFNNDDEWKDIDKPIDIKMDNPKIKDTKISGIDPVTGNEMEVGLDEDGYLTESTLPSSIKIVVPPDKRQYVEGQPILFRGMVVKAYTADGNLWTDAGHNDGVIPHSELTFPVTIAHAGEGGGRYYDVASSSLLDYSVPINTSFSYEDPWHKDGVVCNVENGVVAILLQSADSQGTEYHYYINCIIASKESRIKYKQNYLSLSQYTYNGRTVYYKEFFETNQISTLTSGHAIGDMTLRDYSHDYAKIAWTMIYGDIRQEGNTVPVQYTRSDGEVLEDSFAIEVLPDPDGAHPQVDPSTVEWNHRRYKANEDLGAVEVRHGSVYMEGGAIYDVGAAVRLGMLEPVDNEIVP